MGEGALGLLFTLLVHMCLLLSVFPSMSPSSCSDSVFGTHSLATFLRRRRRRSPSEWMHVCPVLVHCSSGNRGKVVSHARPRNHVSLLAISLVLLGSLGPSWLQLLCVGHACPHWMLCRSGYPQTHRDPSASGQFLTLKIQFLFYN